MNIYLRMTPVKYTHITKYNFVITDSRQNYVRIPINGWPIIAILNKAKKLLLATLYENKMTNIFKKWYEIV